MKFFGSWNVFDKLFLCIMQLQEYVAQHLHVQLSEVKHRPTAFPRIQIPRDHCGSQFPMFPTLNHSHAWFVALGRRGISFLLIELFTIKTLTNSLMYIRTSVCELAILTAAYMLLLVIRREQINSNCKNIGIRLVFRLLLLWFIS